MHTILYQNDTPLARAFDLPRGVTALVGGGGKTTLMLRLARELAEGGARVIVTTTTHIFPPEGIVTLEQPTEIELTAALERDRLVCLGKRAEQGKLSAPALPVSRMAQLADYVIAEADGSKQLPLKAPAAHEPVIPPETRLVIAVAGLDGVGKPIRDAVFRPALYAALCGKREDDPVTARDIALVLAHPDGQWKGVGEDMRFAVLLNKTDSESRKKDALEISLALQQYPVERAVIASLGGAEGI